MNASHFFFKKQRRAPMPPGDDTLAISQVRWLGALMLGTQLPMLAWVPLWIACLGTALVGLAGATRRLGRGRHARRLQRPERRRADLR